MKEMLFSNPFLSALLSLKKYAFNEYKYNYSQEYEYFFMLLAVHPIESTIFDNNFFKRNMSH